MIKLEKTYAFLIIILLLALLANGLFFFILKPELNLLFQDQASSWFTNLVNWVYPRFQSESHRFKPDFFISKASQVILRFNIVSVFIVIISFAFSKSENLKKQWKTYWNGKISVNITTLLMVIFYLGMIAYTMDWFGYLSDYFLLKEFYKPVFFYKVLGIPFPNQIAINLIFFIFWSSCIFAVIQIKPLVSSILASFFFISILGFLQSFEKINHGYATFGFVALLIPLLVLEKDRTKPNAKGLQQDWPLKLIQVSIVLAYFFSGIEKLLISGIHWISGETFSGYLKIATEGIFRQILLDYHLLVILFANCVLFFQLSFWIILYKRKLKWIYLPLGILFHWGTILALGVGTWNSPWIFVYIFFLPFDKINNNRAGLFKNPKRN